MKGWGYFILAVGAIIAAIFTVFVPDWDRPPVETVQTGYRAISSVQFYNPRELKADAANHAAPEAPFPWAAAEDAGAVLENGAIDPARLPRVPFSERADQVYENVQVLGGLDVEQFNRLMTSITEWVSPEQSCEYCHNLENLADESKYTYQVSRRMIQMTQAINRDWGKHVAPSGVTCYSCHRGQPVPEYIWFQDPPSGVPEAGYLGHDERAFDVELDVARAYATNLPYEKFILNDIDDNSLKVQSRQALPGAQSVPIELQPTTHHYEFMMRMSRGMGVNCTYCHNSRAWSDWEDSSPKRAIAWYAIRMTQELNADYIHPLSPIMPADHAGTGPTGDIGKSNCETCHQGAYKPLYGANMIQFFPSLGPVNPDTPR